MVIAMEVSFEYIFLSIFSVISFLLCLKVISTKNGSTTHEDFKTVVIFIICLDIVEFSAYQALAFGHVLVTELLAGAFLMIGSFFVTSLFVFSANLAGNKAFEKFKALFYLPCFVLIFLHSQNLIVSGFVINATGMLHEDGPLSAVYDAHLVGYLIMTLMVLTINSRNKDALLSSRSRLMLLGILPLIVMILIAVAVPYVNISVVLPLLTIYLLISLEYITGKNIINISSGFVSSLRTFKNLSSGFTTSTITLNEYRDIVEKEFILNEVKKGGSINEIAERLDIHSTTFRNKLKKYEISKH
jgi:hypothetical protein